MEQPGCIRKGICHITGGEPFDLLPENIEVTEAFKMVLKFAALEQVRVEGRKKGETEYRMIPVITNISTILDNWYRPLSRNERAEWVYLIGVMFDIVKANRMA